jgi:hydrogenase expression/formation protein HypD
MACYGRIMKYVDEFRNAACAERLLAGIRHRATQRWTLMEVCGGQTHGLLRYGIDEALAQTVELIHGPGCPVCVTSTQWIDAAIKLALLPGVTLATFGDMLRIPGSGQSLAAARALAANVRTVYSPLDAVQLAADDPQGEVVFFAVGFETTAPATALAVLQAAKRGIANFSLLVAHVRVQPAMEAVLQSPHNRVQAFLAAGHVCTVAGYESYRDLCRKYQVPIVVTGFEPVDLLQGIAAAVDQLESGRCDVVNCYERIAHADGNPLAQQFVDEVFEIRDCDWRGMGELRDGGLKLRDAWRNYDAIHRFMLPLSNARDSGVCRSGDVLTGTIKPIECPAYGRECTPDHPLGAPMVSSEGACAAYYLHGRAAACDQQ